MVLSQNSAATPATWTAESAHGKKSAISVSSSRSIGTPTIQGAESDGGPVSGFELPAVEPIVTDMREHVFGRR